MLLAELSLFGMMQWLNICLQMMVFRRDNLFTEKKPNM